MAARFHWPFKGTITWSGSGASLAANVSGVRPGDMVFAALRTAPTQAAYIKSIVCSADTITITLSAANTSNDAQVDYIIAR